MSKEFAPGIKRKEYLGDEKKLKPGQLLDFVVQYHQATRRGPHYDFRIGNKPLGMYSWALNRIPPTKEGERIGAIRTSLHSHAYNKFEGLIPPGKYGAGRVTKHDEGKVLVTHTTNNTISFSVAHKKHPERFTLVKPEGLDNRQWILLKQKVPEHPGAEKTHYKNLSRKDIKQVLDSLPKGSEVQAKIDGALNFLNIRNGKLELLSHRRSKTTGKPVIHTERFFGKVPHLSIPKEFKNSVLLTEVYGERNGKAIPVQELGGILNASLYNSLKKQKEDKIKLKAIIFDIAKLNGKPIQRDRLPYEERKKLISKLLGHLPKDKFHLPEAVTTKEQAKKLFQQIAEGKHPLTREGVVIHTPHGTPMKHKIMPEDRVYIRGTFPAEKGSKYEGKGIGGFIYSTSPNGAIVGKIGTGLSDALRIDAYRHPENYIGRVARVHSHGKFPSGAHRVPVFLGLHEDY